MKYIVFLIFLLSSWTVFARVDNENLSIQYVNHQNDNYFSNEILNRGKLNWFFEYADFPAMPVTDTWNYWTFSNRLVALSYYISCAGSSVDLSSFLFLKKQWDNLIISAKNGYWWNENGQKGDENLNRFVLFAFLESLYILRDQAETKVFLAKNSKWIELAVQYQRKNYAGKLDSKPSPFYLKYPNQDVTYALILFYASVFFDEKLFKDESHDVILSLQNNQFSGGGFHYVLNETEAPTYHGLNVTYLIRYADVAQDDLAFSLVIKSLPYFSKILTDQGQPEYWSAPWWKQYWGEIPWSSLAIIRSVTGDGRLLFYENALRDQKSFKDLTIDFTYAALYWKKPQNNKIIKPLKNNISSDSDVFGVRAKYNNFYLGAARGYGARNTFIGAMLGGRTGKISDRYISVLSSVGVFLDDKLTKKTLWLSGLDDQFFYKYDEKNFSVCAHHGLFPTYINVLPKDYFTKSKVDVQQFWFASEVGFSGFVKVKYNHDNFTQPILKIGLSDVNFESLSDDLFKVGAFFLKNYDEDVKISVSPHQSENNFLNGFIYLKFEKPKENLNNEIVFKLSIGLDSKSMPKDLYFDDGFFIIDHYMSNKNKFNLSEICVF